MVVKSRDEKRHSRSIPEEWQDDDRNFRDPTAVAKTCLEDRPQQ